MGPSQDAAATWKGAPRRLASSRRASIAASGWAAATTAGTPRLKMPAFSRAIASTRFPRNCMWSRPMRATAATSGVTALVASKRPPSPTSTTAASTRSRAM